MIGAAPAVSSFLMAPTTTKKKKPEPVCESRVALERRAFELSQRCPEDRSNPGDGPRGDLRPLPASDREA